MAKKSVYNDFFISIINTDGVVIMANLKNKLYSNTRKSSSTKDAESHYYYYRQEKAQDRLINNWIQNKTLTRKVGGPDGNTTVEKPGNNRARNILRHSPR
jgi:hypothetical protein